MSSTNPDSKPANLITAWTQRDWCWIVVFTVFSQRNLAENGCFTATTFVIMTTDKHTSETYYLW